MKIAFNTPARKGLTALLVALMAVAYVGFAATQFIAFWMSERAELSTLRRAAWLDPGNAEYRHLVGRYYDLVARDPASALEQYKAAVQLDSHSARYWFDLSTVYQILGDIPNQTSALEHAIQADPMTPDVAWEAGNLYLVQGENEKALRELKVVIANDPYIGNAALQLCWRLEPDVDALLRDVIPARSQAYLEFLALLQAKKETAGTVKVWNALMQTNQPFEARFSYDYIRYLIDHKEVDQAVLVWRQTLDRFGLSSYLPSSENLIVNGNFDQRILNAGFDWQYRKQSSVTLNLDPSDFHGGRHSLEITFEGPGINDAGILQLVAVQPNTTYDFTAYYKNNEMEGAGGPHFSIQDIYDQTVYYESDELKDSEYWKPAEGEFTTGADCKLVVLHIRRLPAGSPIRGKLWVDDFHLTRKPSQVQAHR